MGTNIPKPALERLPRYLRALRRERGRGKSFMSSNALGQASGVEEFQVRKDLSHVQVSGRPGRGYRIESLIVTLEHVLGLDEVRDAVVVGAGRLGQALSQYPGFENFGFNIVRLFDNDPEKVGQQVGDFKITHVQQMPEWINRHGISVAMMTVPADCAQEVADQLIKDGVTGLWNFAPVLLRVPEHVVVRHEDLAIGLAQLSHHMAWGRSDAD